MDETLSMQGRSSLIEQVLGQDVGGRSAGPWGRSQGGPHKYGTNPGT